MKTKRQSGLARIKLCLFSHDISYFVAGKSKDLDEVRIIRKVVGRPVDRSVCLAALNLSRWDIHLAIKIIKLVTQVYEEQGIKLEVNQSSTLDILQQNEWDVAKAANAILHRDQQYFWPGLQVTETY